MKESSLDTDTCRLISAFNQSTDTIFRVVARTSQCGRSVLPAIDAVVRKIDPGIGTLDGSTMVSG